MFIETKRRAKNQHSTFSETTQVRKRSREGRFTPAQDPFTLNGGVIWILAGVNRPSLPAYDGLELFQ